MNMPSSPSGRIRLELLSKPRQVTFFDLSDLRIEDGVLRCAIGEFPLADVAVIAVYPHGASQEKIRLVQLLAHAVKEADGYHDDEHGGPITDDPLIDEARQYLDQWMKDIQEDPRRLL